MSSVSAVFSGAFKYPKKMFGPFKHTYERLRYKSEYHEVLEELTIVRLTLKII